VFFQFTVGISSIVALLYPELFFSGRGEGWGGGRWELSYGGIGMVAI